MRRLNGSACLCLISLLCFSCSSDQNIKYKYEIEPFLNNPRVFYGETGEPTKTDSGSETCEILSEEEINLIQKLVSEKTQKPIWFVRLPLMSYQDLRLQIWVYLAPDVMETRYRSGQAYTLEIYKNKETNVRTISDSSWHYIQVSLPNKEFGSVLNTPKVHNLPFRYPPEEISGSENKQEILSNEEIISLLDYIRDPNSYKKFNEHEGISREYLPNGEVITKISPPLFSPNRISQYLTKPVASIYKNSDEINVYFGFKHHGTYARYSIIILKKTKDGYEIINRGTQVS